MKMTIDLSSEKAIDALGAVFLIAAACVIAGTATYWVMHNPLIVEEPIWVYAPGIDYFYTLFNIFKVMGAYTLSAVMTIIATSAIASCFGRPKSTATPKEKEDTAIYKDWKPEDLTFKTVLEYWNDDEETLAKANAVTLLYIAKKLAQQSGEVA